MIRRSFAVLAWLLTLSAGTTSTFAGRLRDQVDLDAIVGDMRSGVDASVHPATVSVWIQFRNETRTLEA